MMLKLAAAGALALVSIACSERTENAAETAPAAQACNPPQIVLRRPDGVIPRNATYQNSGTPPIRFRGDKSFYVQFVAPDQVEKACGLEKPVCGYRMLACRRGNKLILPNPCSGNSILEPFGKLTCHELGHANGWPAIHGD